LHLVFELFMVFAIENAFVLLTVVVFTLLLQEMLL